MSKKKSKVKTNLHPEGTDNLPGPVVEVEAEFDGLQPIIMQVDRAGACVVFAFSVGKPDVGPLKITVPWPVAQQWAETVLACVADIRGVEAFMFTMGKDTRMLKRKKS